MGVMQPEGRGKPLKDVVQEREIPGFLRTNSKIIPPKLPLEVHSSILGESLNTIPQSSSPVWTKYRQKDEVELNGRVSVAQANDRLGACVLVRQMSKERLYRKLRILAQFRRQPYFSKTFEIFFSGSMVDVVCEYVELTLRHIFEALRFPTEKEVSAIAGQGSLLRVPLLLHPLTNNSS
jgi:hypothetical protein